jgi:hypothetical protein
MHPLGKGTHIGQDGSLSHILFVDDILIFFEGNIHYLEQLDSLLTTFNTATNMSIKKSKSSSFFRALCQEEEQAIITHTSIQLANIEDGFKYLGFFLKSNNYQNIYWLWLQAKIEKRI